LEFISATRKVKFIEDEELEGSISATDLFAEFDDLGDM
jgi:hypothetical protein